MTEFEEGNISDKIILYTTCDVNELTEKYNLFSIKTNGYGFFLGEDGEVGCIKLHCKDGNGDYDSNDDRANELYKWYIRNCLIEK